MNPQLTWEIIEQHPDKSIGSVSSNPNVTWNIVDENLSNIGITPNYLNIHLLSCMKSIEKKYYYIPVNSNIITIFFFSYNSFHFILFHSYFILFILSFFHFFILSYLILLILIYLFHNYFPFSILIFIQTYSKFKQFS